MSTHAENMMHMEMQMRRDHSPPSSSSRILDIPCKVCGDFSSGKHYNIFACDGCAGFFKRSIRRNREYVCKAKEEGTCVVDKTHRNQCRACRLTKCHEAGMNKDAVQHERGPRNSTLRRQQLAHYIDPRDRILGTSGSVLDLAKPKQGTLPTIMEQNIPMSPAFMYNPGASQLSSMNLSPAPILHPMLQPAAICESAARLLFMNVQWTRNVPSFITLSLEDQLILLEESWHDLFILGASQFLMLDLTSLVQACGFIERQPELVVSFLQDVRMFQETLAKIAEFRLDPHEYACLRAIVLFKGNLDNKIPRGLSDPAGIFAIHEHTQLTLNKYITTVHPGQPLRFGKLLMLLPTLHNVPGYIIEELFFRQSIGPIPIVRIICDMYKSPKPDVL